MADKGQANRGDDRAQMDNLQKRYDNYVEKRNELNDLGKKLRAERDMLNDATKDFRARMDAAKTQRDKLNAEMREAKKRRNEFQEQAKALIASKQAKGGDFSKSLPLQARHLEKEIRDMEYQHMTQPQSIEKERDFLKALKAKKEELAELQEQLDENKSLKVDLDDLDTAIDDLFKRADEEHAKVQALHKESNKHHEEFVEALEESKVVRTEANDKHKEYIATRERADEQHNKAMEIREQLLAIRGEQRAERERARNEIRAFNNQAKQALNDPNKRKEVEEDAISALKKGGKISLGV